VKRKLEINLNTHSWNCWVCGNRDNFKGVKLQTLFNKINVSNDKILELNKLTKSHVHLENVVKPQDKSLELPKEFISLATVSPHNIMARHALSYLKKRNITEIDVIRYNIGFCEYGEYKNMIVIPSYDSDFKLNWFSTRSFEEDAFIKTRNPKTSKNIIGFESLINFEVPIILCEGAFDAITARRNAVPLFGKTISDELMKKIVTSKVNKIYIALDNDAMKDAIKHCERLLSFNKQVYLIYLDKKDINEMGFEEFIKTAQQTKKLTTLQLMKYKMKI